MVTDANTNKAANPYEVAYVVNKTGVLVTKGFPSPYLAHKLVNKLKHSKICTLVSYPIYN